ncbi:MAG: DUF433 domain-containing protein [Chthoniobacteraceae bacterium]
MERIVINPDICNGQPTIQGTRIPARTVLEFFAAGDSIGEVLEEYPALTREDVLACIGLSSESITFRSNGSRLFKTRNPPG